MGNRVKGDAMLGKKRLVLLQAVDEVSLLRLFLSPPRRLGWDNLAFDLGLDTVGTRLLLVASYLSLLAEVSLADALINSHRMSGVPQQPLRRKEP